MMARWKTMTLSMNASYASSMVVALTPSLDSPFIMLSGLLIFSVTKSVLAENFSFDVTIVPRYLYSSSLSLSICLMVMGSGFGWCR